MPNEEIGLCNVRRRDVVSQEEDSHGSLGVCVFAKDRAAKGCKQLRSDAGDRRLTGRRFRIELFVEEVVIEVGSCGKGIKCPSVEFAHTIDEDRRELCAFRVPLVFVQIHLGAVRN